MKTHTSIKTGEIHLILKVKDGTSPEQIIRTAQALLISVGGTLSSPSRSGQPATVRPTAMANQESVGMMDTETNTLDTEGLTDEEMEEIHQTSLLPLNSQGLISIPSDVNLSPNLSHFDKSDAPSRVKNVLIAKAKHREEETDDSYDGMKDKRKASVLKIQRQMRMRDKEEAILKEGKCLVGEFSPDNSVSHEINKGEIIVKDYGKTKPGESETKISSEGELVVFTESGLELRGQSALEWQAAQKKREEDRESELMKMAELKAKIDPSSMAATFLSQKKKLREEELAEEGRKTDAIIKQ